MKVVESTLVYSNEWVAMQNSIIECFKYMSVDEKRVILIASSMARVENINFLEPICFTAEEYAYECGIDVNNAYKQLDIASKQLMTRHFSYLSSKDKKIVSNWVMDCAYEYGAAKISIRFTELALVALKELDKVNPYTKYKKEIALQLQKSYSIDLYHLLKKNQHKVVFDLSIEELNQELGFPESYERMDNLKRFFLLPTIEEINEKTDILVSYENVKQGRKVVAFRFTVKYKTTVAKEVEDVLSTLPAKKKTRKKGLTDKQIAKISIYKNEFVDRNQHMIKNVNADYYQAFEDFKVLLQDPNSVNEFNDIDLFLSVKKGEALPQQQENKELERKNVKESTQKENTDNPPAKKRGRPKKVEIVEKNYSVDNLILGDLTLSKSMVILVKNKKDNETLEQTYERIKHDYPKKK